jgi:hypothetical protein
MDLILFFFILRASNESMAANLLAESNRCKVSEPEVAMNLRKQAYKLIGLK